MDKKETNYFQDKDTHTKDLSFVFVSSPIKCLEYAEGKRRRKIRLIESNAKCRHLKKLICKGTLRQRPEAHNIPPPLHTVYVYTVILIHTGKGGGELYQRKGYRGNRSQSWVENTNMTDCIFSL